MTTPVRTVVWSTGGVGSIAIDAIRRRPDLELVGVWVHSDEKVGRDAGELIGAAPLGVTATNDAAALIGLRPDCVVYAASGPERDAAAVPDYVQLLQAGINVVSTSSTSLIYPPAYYSDQWRDQLDAAAKSGSASFYASGIFPGFGSDQLALLMTTQSKKIRCIKVSEIALNRVDSSEMRANGCFVASSEMRACTARLPDRSAMTSVGPGDGIDIG